IRLESLQRISERRPLRRMASSKFKLVFQIAAPHWIATYRTGRACAVAVDRAARSGCWQSAAQDRFAGFLSEDWLVEHSSPPGMAVPVHAQRMLQTKGNPDGTRAETQSTVRIIHPVSRTGVLETAPTPSWGSSMTRLDAAAGDFAPLDLAGPLARVAAY